VTIIEDNLSGLIIVLPEGDALARERVLAPMTAEPWPRPAPRQDLISRLFPRKSRAED
jgi:hypothetical protein